MIVYMYIPNREDVWFMDIVVLEEGVVSATEPSFCAFCNPIMVKKVS